MEKSNKHIIGMTTNCIGCLSVKLYTHSGYVKKGSKHILAGWCLDHFNSPKFNFANTKGCYGGWINEYGFKYFPSNDTIFKRFMQLFK